MSAPSMLTVATASGLQPLGSAQSNMADTPSQNYIGNGSSGRTAAISGKNKLPHGLTVHELKEMTKARLQAEAAERPENGVDSCSPLAASDSVDGNIQQHQVPYLSASTNSNPGVVGRHIQSSPLTAAGAQSFRPVAQRSETWESASVASYSSMAGLSDNFGSESVSDTGGSHPGNRTRSFTYPAVHAPDQHNFSANANLSCDSSSNPSSAQASPSRAGFGFSHGQSSFDAAVGCNRRRAVTLSPNAGFILEDRPQYYGSTIGTDNLVIPGFSTKGSSDGSSRIQTSQRNFSPVLGQLGLSVLENSYLDSQRTGPASSFGGVLDDTFRRSTGSAITSMPSVSQVAATTPERHSLNDIPTTRSTGISLRDTSSITARVASPPPGFAGSDSLLHSGTDRTAFSRVGSFGRIPEKFNEARTSHWDSDFVVSRPHFASVDNLANDMGTLLNLSGTSTPERPDRGRANTYTFGAASNPLPSGSFFASLPEDDFVGTSDIGSNEDLFR